MKIQLDKDIKQIRMLLLNMGKKVEYALSQSILSLNNNDSVVARQVISNDKDINRLEIDLDKICHKIFALQSPIAVDLRFVASTLKVNNDLERMGDLASRIASDVVRLIELDNDEWMPYTDDLQNQYDLGKQMSKLSLHAFINRDVDLARMVILDDNKMDDFYSSLINKLIPFVHKDSKRFEIALSVVNISKSLERIADHAVNISENAVYLGEGKIVKHHYNQ